MASQSLRILCIGETWLGSDARASFAALRRQGHSVHVLDENNYVSNLWQTNVGRGLRNIFRPWLVRELTNATLRASRTFQPHCLFVFKGNYVHPRVIARCRQQGIVTINFYPDVSFRVFGPYIPRALPIYDHIFTTKTFGVDDLHDQLGITDVSFLEHGYDPDLHYAAELTAEEKLRYSCDVNFIGTWQPKNESLLSSLKQSLPQIKTRIWGSQWDRAKAKDLKDSIMGTEVTGDEYRKALRGASICLGLLRERLKGSSSGDLITARTFQIPACGIFMLHERNVEVLRYFEEDREAAFFGSPEELARKVRHYLDNPAERERIADAGLKRSLRDGYAIDARMKVVLDWLGQRLNGSVARASVNHAQAARGED